MMLAIFVLFTQCLPMFGQDDAVKQADSIEISLLTCMPRPYVYSLYGHTAIRYKNDARGMDLVVNYGVFSFDKPFFVLRFVFGLTDYEMGIEYFDDFKAQYEKTGCGVLQQTLNLTTDEKIAVSEAIDRNYQPENRVYRYNYLYDNCTTRARDILINSLNGKVNFNDVKSDGSSYRAMIHAYNKRHLWARFGNDLLLGLPADCHTSFEQQQFLPENLSRDFAKAQVLGTDGTSRQLVAQTLWVLPVVKDSGAEEFPLSPRVCMAILAVSIILLTFTEMRRRKFFSCADLLLLGLTGLCGLVLFAMIFSKHPTVSLNLQILLLNPLCLVFLYSEFKASRYGRLSCWTKLWTICILLFILGGFWQTYAEGLYFLALSLLFRNIIKIRLFAKKSKK